MTHATAGRRGTYSILNVLALPALMGFGAIAVDLSYQKVVRAELQATADISAVAGVAALDGTEEGLVSARAAVVRAAARNFAGGEPVQIDPTDIESGYWDGDHETFVQTDDPALVDALRVTARRSDISTGFAAVAFARDEVAALGDSLASNPLPTPAGAVSCYIPLAVADCLFDEYSPEALEDFEFTLSPAGVDNVGWARVESHPNASWLRAQIGDCTGDGTASVGDDVGLHNGVVSSALAELVDVIEDSDTSWDSERWGPIPSQWSKSAIDDYGSTYEGPIIVFDGGEEYCEAGGGPFNRFEEIVGFAWAVIYDVQTKGGAADKNIRVRLDMMAAQTLGEAGGGLVDAGVIYDQPLAIIR